MRRPLLLIAVLALIGGLWAGLARLGWRLPAVAIFQPALHGPLMISGFLGALITLERAVALSQGHGRAVYAAPAGAALGAVALLAPLPAGATRALGLLGPLGLAALFVLIVRRQPNLEHGIMGLGALLWLAGNGLWLGGAALYQVVPWWAGFLVLTVAGERLELARILLRRRGARALFLLAVAVFVAGLVLSVPAFAAGMRLAGAGLLALGLWLLRYDLARRTIRQRGLTRYIAACLLPGYAWLGVAGALWLVYGGRVSAGPAYDALVHAVFLGFIFSMIFGHAPIILPAVLGRPLAYSPLFYGHLALLHLSLVLRLAGDLAPWFPARQWGGLLNEVAVLLFLAVMVGHIRRTSPALPPPTRSPDQLTN